MENKLGAHSLAGRLLLLIGLLCAACGSATMMPSVAARRWVGPQVSVPGGGQFRTVIYYGPWQCSSDLMNYCRRKCAGSGHALQGCMWLADVNFDFEGRLMQAGSRFGMTHCCCNYGTLSPTANNASRQRWDDMRSSFRDSWARRFGAWPTEPNGTPFQGHHVHDLWHGGNPTDWDNIIPFPRDLHQDLPALYNQCYANNPPWNSPGVDYPYAR